MRLNCRRGDIAIVVRGPSTGAVVSVVAPWSGRSVLKQWLGLELFKWQCETLSPAFNAVRRFDGARIDLQPGQEVVSPDCILRPLRDQEGDDEMLHIAGRPLQRKAPAIARAKTTQDAA